MVSRPDDPRWLVHAYVECRARNQSWWLYAEPALSPDPRLASLLSGAEVDEGDAVVNALGVPRDASPPVLDDYGARPESRATGLADRRWECATWMTLGELERVLQLYGTATGQPAPATYCALHAMMRELERDYIVRVILWFERLSLADGGQTTHVRRGARMSLLPQH